MDQKIIVESLSMDLLRLAMGLHRGSFQMAERFKQEVVKRQDELETQETNPYLKYLIEKSKAILNTSGDRMAEDALMYSVLFQNFARKYYG